MRGAGRAIGSIAVVALVLVGGRSALAKGCGGPCGEDGGCAREVAACLVKDGRHAEALEVLKQVQAEPGDGQMARLLSLAYAGTGNRIWALRTLLDHLEAAPDDLEARTWAAWLMIQEGALDQAQALLEAAEAPGSGTLAERLELLAVTISRLRGEDEEAERGLEEVEGGGKLLPEDVSLVESLRTQLLGKHSEFLGARVILAGGYTTNAVQSAPQDVGTGLEGAGAPVLSLDLVLRLEPWTSPLARPVAEIRAKGFMPLSGDARDFGYLSLGGRAGAEIGRMDGFRARLYYGYELLGILDRGWYMTAHRGELELDVLPYLLVFGGVGRRIYEHLPRTRTEMDLGMALVLALGGGWNLTGIVAGRVQLARHEAFDDRGVTALVRMRIPLPVDFMIKLRYMVLYDVYPSSAGYYSQERDRQDLMLKTEAGVWSPSLSGFRVGVTYNLAHRWSTVENILDNFNFTDHRFLLQVRWQGSLDPTLPGKARVGEDHLPLPYGFELEGDTGLDRVQDLLGQEDSARRGSMCVD